MDLTCYFCGAMADLEDGIEAGWIPSFWDGETPISDPCCDKCFETRIVIGEDGEYEVRKDDVPMIAEAS